MIPLLALVLGSAWAHAGGSDRPPVLDSTFVACAAAVGESAVATPVIFLLEALPPIGLGKSLVKAVPKFRELAHPSFSEYGLLFSVPLNTGELIGASIGAFLPTRAGLIATRSAIAAPHGHWLEIADSAAAGFLGGGAILVDLIEKAGEFLGTGKSFVGYPFTKLAFSWTQKMIEIANDQNASCTDKFNRLNDELNTEWRQQSAEVMPYFGSL